MTANNQLAVAENGRAAQAPAMLSHRFGIGLQDLGHIMAASGYFKDAQHEAQAIVKILYGEELGIQPVSAMMGIHIIEGKPAPSANLVATLIKKHPRYDYAVRYWDTDGCTLEFFEGGQSVGEVTFNQQDARAAGLIQRKMWQQYPKAMYFARALTMGARTFAADVFGGAPVYTPEELGCEVDEDGNPVNLPAPKAPPAAPPPAAASSRKQNELRNAARAAAGNSAPAAPAVQNGAAATGGISTKQKELIVSKAKARFGANVKQEMNKLLTKKLDDYTEAEADTLLEYLKKLEHAAMNNARPTQAGMVRDAIQRGNAAEKAERDVRRETALGDPAIDLKPLFATMHEKNLPDNRELRLATLNLYLEKQGDVAVDSFTRLTQQQANGFLALLKNDRAGWNPDGGFYVNTDAFYTGNINRPVATDTTAEAPAESAESAALAEESHF